MRRTRATATILITLAISGLVGAIAFWAASEFFVSQAERSVRSLMLSHRGMHLYIQRVMHPALNALKASGAVPYELYAPEILSSSYIVREQHQLYNEVRREQGLEPVYYKMAADNPRNPVNRADDHEEKLIAFFNTHRDQTYYDQVVEQQGGKYLYFAAPFLANTQACLRCHGLRADAPVQLQQRYPGQGGFGESVGRIRAIESLRIPIDTETRWAWMASAMLLAGAFAFGGLVLTNRWLARRVKERTQNLERETVERRRAEETLSVTQFAVDMMSDSVYRLGSDGTILYANEAGVRQLGYTREELLAGMPVIGISETLTPDKWQEVWKTLTATGHHHIETRHRRKDGTTFPVEVYASYVRFGSDEFAWVVARDLTERKRLEAQFLEAQKMEAIGALAGGIAHDFNNILGAVRGYAELAFGAMTPECEGRDDIRQILLAADRARDLVRQILDFSRKGQREKAPLQVGIIASEALKLLRASLPATIEIRDRIDVTIWALADPTGFHQVVMNLCTNAFQAMRDTGGVLVVELALVGTESSDIPSVLAPGPCVRLRVRDTGPGIAPEVMKHIFEPYFTTKETSGGTGLGLSVVHGLTSSWAGTVTVESELGHGSTFDVWLLPAEAPPQAPRVESKSMPHGRERILVVDDEESVRAVARRMLAALGYSVRAATNAQEALDLIRVDPSAFDLVLMDQTMPKMTGLALAGQLRKSHPFLKIVLMSGFSEAIQGRNASQIGVDALLPKPFTSLEIATAIRTVCDAVPSAAVD